MTEAELKVSVTKYLDFLQNLGKLMWFRLNSGDFIEVRGNTRRRIRGCKKGTADFMIIRIDGSLRGLKVPNVTFIELKSKTGKQSTEQGEFQDKVVQFGCGYYIVRSLKKLEDILWQPPSYIEEV